MSFNEIIAEMEFCSSRLHLADKEELVKLKLHLLSLKSKLENMEKLCSNLLAH